MPRLLLMADYGATPLWNGNGTLNLDWGDVPLTAPTREALARWARWYDSLPERDFAWNAGEEAAFDAEGRRLWDVVREELGREWEVRYFSEPLGQRLAPD